MLAHARQVPRYTSYPTAPHFVPMGAQTHADWLGRLGPDPVSLYVHVPYCKQLCWFCGCNTKITERYAPVEDYLHVMKREMRLVADAIGRRQPVSHLHFGGGSPTMLTPDDFARCMGWIRECFDLVPAVEIAVEADPRGMTEAKIAAYAKAGVNRISLGVQDFEVEVQQAIHRVQSFSTIYDAVRLCRDYGIEHISFDLMYGLPRQTPNSMRRSIEFALLLNPNRISLFGYAHVPWKKKNMRLIKDEELPDEALRLALFEQSAHLLAEAGYAQIGLDHFALPGDEMAAAVKAKTLRRNFQGYTTDKADTLIGLGASAISSFELGYVQNNPLTDQYEKAVMHGRFATAKGVTLTDDDRLRRRIIEQLMCYFEADVNGLCAGLRMPAAMFDEVFTMLKPLEADGFVSIQNGHVRVNADYPQAVRLVSAAFDRYFIPEQKLYSRVA